MLAADLIVRLIDFLGADIGGEGAMRSARRAMQDAVKSIAGLHRWTYHYTYGRLQLKGAYSSGTVAVNSSTRAVTLATTDGTVWPSWAAAGSIRVNDVAYKVSTRDSNTQLTLDATLTPAADIAAGAGFNLYQDTYELPADFLASDHAVAEYRFGELSYVQPGEWLWAIRTAEREGPPLFYTFFPSVLFVGRFALRLWPFPDADQTLDFTYQRRPRAVKYDIVSDGNVSCTNGSTAVTGVGTRFRADMAGSTLRVGWDGVQPTGNEGNNPGAFDAVVSAVGSTTSLTLATAAPQTLAAVAYVLSDPLDVEEPGMATALAWKAIEHLAAEKNHKNLGAVTAKAKEELILAKEADARNYSRQVVGERIARRRSRRYMPQGPDEI